LALTPADVKGFVAAQGATMLLDSAFGDLWMPLAVFVTLGVTFGIGLSRLLRCILLAVIPVQIVAEP